MKKMIIIVLVLLFALTFTACNTQREQIPEKTKEVVKELKLKNIEEYNGHIHGEVKNTTGIILETIQIDVVYYNENGAVIGQDLDLFTNLEINETWKFKIPIMYDYEEFDTFKVSISQW